MSSLCPNVGFTRGIPLGLSGCTRCGTWASGPSANADEFDSMSEQEMLAEFGPHGIWYESSEQLAVLSQRKNGK